MARYRGTAQSDRFNVNLAQVAGSTFDGGSGFDTLAVLDQGGYTFASSSYAKLTSIEALDFSAHVSGQLNVLLSSSMMTQSGTGTLTIVAGAGGIDNLRAGSSVGGTVIVSGSGEVYLDGGTNNIVTLAGAVAVHGGAGSDTITAGAGGSLLDGGAGNDNLRAGGGADRVVFGSGDRADTVIGFNVAADKITLEGTGFTHLSQVLNLMADSASGAQLKLGNGDTLTLAGVAVADLSAGNFTGIAAGAPTYTIEPGTSAATLNALIAQAGVGATFILADGLHLFDRSIVIGNDGVTFRGTSENGTVIRFAFPAGQEADGIVVEGGNSVLLGAATSATAVGDTGVTLASTAGLKVGDTLLIVQQNDPDYMAANGWGNVSAADLAAHLFREVHRRDRQHRRQHRDVHPLAAVFDGCRAGGGLQDRPCEWPHGVGLHDRSASARPTRTTSPTRCRRSTASPRCGSTAPTGRTSRTFPSSMRRASASTCTPTSISRPIASPCAAPGTRAPAATVMACRSARPSTRR